MYLNCHTYYSLRFGTFSETDLLQLAKEMEVGCVALTDINNTSACLNFVRKAPEYGVRPLLGIDFRNGVEQEFVGLAVDNNGFYELNDFLSDHLHRSLPFDKRAPEFQNAFVIYPFEKVLEEEMVEFTDKEFIGVSVADLRKLPFSRYIQDHRDRLVVQQPVTFRNKRDFNAHRLLRAIDNNILLSKLDKKEEASEEERMYPMSNLAMAFREHSFILENTRSLMEQCRIDFDFSDTKPMQNQRSYTGDEEADWQLLRELCDKGLPYRYPEVGQAIIERVEKELSVIREMNFVSYFLINHDIITYAKSKGYFHVGRGSGANSVVAYLLGITDVDPMELDLYFERFINRYRTSPPDFDIDFSWRDRQDVTRYIFERFPNVALLGAYVTFQYRGVVRELGKVFGLPKEEIDRLSDERKVMQDLDETARLVIKYGQLIHGMPNYVSIHSSGILISERPLHWFSATNMPPKGFPTVQFDMHIAEDVGLYKFDILGQRGLAKIKEAVAILRENRPEAMPFDIHDIRSLKQDAKINAMVSRAQCMGCFYVESPAMRMLLKKLEVDNYLGLVAASSIIRPGVAKSGMMREYILRHRDPERRKDAHPVMQEIMPDTYGVMVYQEDVIKVAHHFAGLTLGEADVLRRGMSGKYRSREEFKRVEDKFVENCREKGYAEEMIQEVWRQVASFAGYAFAKGHSASYAVESYQSLFLRAYFPLEYMVAVLNNGGGFYRTEIYVHEARMLGATIHVPCVNRSFPQHTIRGKDIYMGLLALQELEERTALNIVRERETEGAFRSLDDFVDRVRIGIEQLSILIRINAFRFTGVDKYELLWHAHFKLGVSKKPELQQRLFRPPHRDFEIPVLYTTDLEAAFDQIELLGFCLCSPFELLREVPLNDHAAKDLERFLDRNIDIYGYLVTVKRTRTQHGNKMNFATFIDQVGEVFDCTLFPQVASKYCFRGRGVYRLYGKVVDEFGFLSIEVIKMRKEEYVEDPRYK